MFTNNKSAFDKANREYGADLYIPTMVDYFNTCNIKKTDGTTITFLGDSIKFYRIAYTHDLSLNSSIIAQTDTVSGNGGSSEVVQGHIDMVIGSGTTAPTAEDYALENQILTLEHISVALTRVQNRNVVTRTFRNTDSAAITVREVGIITRLKKQLSISGTVILHPILLARYVLPTPLTVASGTLVTVVAEI